MQSFKNETVSLTMCYDLLGELSFLVRKYVSFKTGRTTHIFLSSAKVNFEYLDYT